MKTKLLMVAAALLVSGTAYAQNPQGETSTEPSTACAFPIANSGAGEKQFLACISSTGNVIRFRSPATAEIIETGTILEGYAVCDSGGVHGWDSAESGSGFNAPVVISASGTSVTISRTTTSGVYRLEQKFSRDNVERDLTVSMKLINLTASARTNVVISRYVDFDADQNGVTNFFDKSVDSVWARGIHGTTLTANNPEQPHQTFVETFGDLFFTSKAGCSPIAQAVPNSGDLAARINYNLGNLGAGKNVTVKVAYRRN